MTAAIIQVLGYIYGFFKNFIWIQGIIKSFSKSDLFVLPGVFSVGLPGVFTGVFLDFAVLSLPAALPLTALAGVFFTAGFFSSLTFPPAFPAQKLPQVNDLHEAANALLKAVG